MNIKSRQTIVCYQVLNPFTQATVIMYVIVIMVTDCAMDNHTLDASCTPETGSGSDTLDASCTPETGSGSDTLDASCTPVTGSGSDTLDASCTPETGSGSDTLDASCTPETGSGSDTLDASCTPETGSGSDTLDASCTPETGSGSDTISESDEEYYSADEKKDQDDSESPTIPFKQTDFWKSCILAQAFNSCLPAFIEDLSDVLALADCLHEKSAFSRCDLQHIICINTNEGNESAAQELLRRVMRKSLYDDFLYSLQNVSERHLLNKLTEEYDKRLLWGTSVNTKHLTDDVLPNWRLKSAITRHISEVSKILKENISVSENLLETLWIFESITAVAKKHILSQKRNMKAESLVDYLCPEGKCTPEFLTCAYIVWHVRTFVEAKATINGFLFTGRIIGEWLEDKLVISDAQLYAVPGLILQVVTLGNDEHQQTANKICTPGLIKGALIHIGQILKEFACIILRIKDGSIILDLEFRSVQGILHFWQEYIDGSLKTKLRKYVLTPEVYQAMAGTDVDLCLEIDERDLLHALKVLIIRQAECRKPRANKYHDFMFMCDTVEIQQLLCPDDDDDNGDDDVKVGMDRTILGESQTELTLPVVPTLGLSTMVSSLPMVTSEAQDAIEDDTDQWQHLCDRLRDILQDKVSQVVISNELQASVAYLTSRTTSTKPYLEINPQHSTMISLRDELATVAQKVQSMFSSLDSDSDSPEVLMESTAFPGKMSDLEEMIGKPENVVDDAEADNGLLDSQQLLSLHFAAMEGNVESVKDLVKAGASVNGQDKDGSTALILAAQDGHTQVVQELLKYGASSDIQGQDGWTALMFAAQDGHTESIQELLKYGASFDIQSQDGWTALMFAAQGGHTESIQELLKYGASFDIQSQDGLTALIFAAKNGHTQVVQELLKYGASFDIQTQDGSTALILAAQNGHTEIIQELLKYGASSDIQSQDGRTALILAAQDGHTEMVQELLKYGASSDIQSQAGSTALLLAAQDGHTEMVQELLKYGASSDIQSQAGSTALILAAQNGHTEIIQELLKYGASSDIQSQVRNDTPLKINPLLAIYTSRETPQ